MTTAGIIILLLCRHVLMDDTTEINEDIEDATKAYDVIINDRENNDIVINEKDTGDDDLEDIETGTDDVDAGEDAKKLLAAQVNAIHVLNMIKELEEDMKLLLEDKGAEAEAVDKETEAPTAVEDAEEADDVDAEIAELEKKLALLTARGEKVREMIVEQTRLLLGEESVLSKVRTKKIQQEINENKKTTSQKSSAASLSDDQEEFLQDLLALEDILKALRKTDQEVFRELRRRKKRPRTKSKLEKDKTSESILDHPAIKGLDNLEYDYDVPTIIVEEEIDGEKVVIEYEDEVPLVVVEEAVVPRPAELPSTQHGHFLYPQPVRTPYQRPRHKVLYPQPYPPHHQYHRHQYPQYSPQYEPHITLTGSLLRGFENLGRRFQK